tara:strand:+ start:238 stop:543 length:306 start_codon:yes stop_codon:yes gene_type:complete
METAEKKIVKVLSNIINRLDDLESEQHTNKKIFFVIKQRLLELNEFTNDILDVIQSQDEDLYVETIEKYSDLYNLINEELDKNIDEDDDILQSMHPIVGES